MKRLFLICISFSLCALLSGQTLAEQFADRIFYGDHIITMDVNNPRAEAVAIRGEKILYVGDRIGAEILKGDETQNIDLGERTLVPGFVDSHGHVASTARYIDYVNVSSPPVGPATSIDDIVSILKKHMNENPPANGDWVMAFGYDDSLLAEKRHPTRVDLDKVSLDVPIYMMHVSGHLGTSNSAALAEAGVDENTPDPEGGVFRRLPGTRVPNGVVEEAAAHALLFPRFKADAQDVEGHKNRLKRAIAYFARYGVTTVQDGATHMPDFYLIREMEKQNDIDVDIISLPLAGNQSPPIDRIKHLNEESFNNRLRIGGIKFILDGSPQGRTAWTTEPYNQAPTGVVGPYTGYPGVNHEIFKREARELLQAGIPIYTHANGDAAIDLALDAVEEAFDGQEIPDHRSVIIHAQLMRQDQLDRAKRLKVVPTFYSAHPYFWGDWHRISFGDKRAFGISPAASALRKGVHFTIHNDTPIVPPDMMRLLWIAVNRETRDGIILGPEERLTTYDALYAMTLGGAYQYFQEDWKGSIEEGKQADLVILDKNPFLELPQNLKDITVLETIARGKTIFKDAAAF